MIPAKEFQEQLMAREDVIAVLKRMKDRWNDLENLSSLCCRDAFDHDCISCWLYSLRGADEMTVRELIEILKTMPQDCLVEVNDNKGGEIYGIEHVDHFQASEFYDESVVLQVNVLGQPQYVPMAHCLHRALNPERMGQWFR